MSTSRDIKALFDRFGGDPTSYREIRTENEAHEARDRWPLLGMIDPRQVEVRAAEAVRGQTLADMAAADNAAGAATASQQETAGDLATASVPGGPAPQDRSQAALRRSAPLFTRSPRRDIAPLVERPAPAVPDSDAFRFSPPPVARESKDEAAQPGTAAAKGAQPPAPPDELASVPVAGSVTGQPSILPAEPEGRVAPRSAGLPPLTMSVYRAAANPSPILPPVAPVARVAPVAAAAPVRGPLAGMVRAPAHAPAGSPLKKLFGGATPAISKPGAAGSAVRLDRLFDRLRTGEQRAAPAPQVKGAGGGPEPAAPSKRPWFLKGVGGP